MSNLGHGERTISRKNISPTKVWLTNEFMSYSTKAEKPKFIESSTAAERTFSFMASQIPALRVAKITIPMASS